jgi:hypothetical protein
MARDTVRKMAEAKADELGITSKDQREWFVTGFIHGMRDGMEEAVKRLQR